MDNFYLGALSGALGIIVSHPFDVIKTRLQNGNRIIFTTKELYRGITPPLIGTAFEKCIVFGVYQNSIIHFDKSIISYSLCGFMSGVSASVVVNMTDRLKILLCTGSKINQLKFKDLTVGLKGTLMRDPLGFAIYFPTYEYLNKRNTNTSILMSSLYGGIAGSVSWIFIYPQDMIKTKIQAGSDKKYTDICQNIYKTGGFKQFYVGFSYAILRAFPLHGGVFGGYTFFTWLLN